MTAASSSRAEPPAFTDAGLSPADRRYRDGMRTRLTAAARHFGLTIDGPSRLGWLDRSISAPAYTSERAVWLRVTTERPDYSGGPAWFGNADAEQQITGIATSRLLDSHEWLDDPTRHIRAEVLTRMPGQPCSPSPTPAPDLDLPPRWWAGLLDTLDRINRTSTTREHADQTHVTDRIRDALGSDLPAWATRIERWHTVHGDLHWANLFRDPFGIVDWELWGTGPAGTDAATLYLYSLATPTVAKAVQTHLRDHLAGPDGCRAQLYVAARILRRARFGDHPELIEPVRDQVALLLDR